MSSTTALYVPDDSGIPRRRGASFSTNGVADLVCEGYARAGTVFRFNRHNATVEPGDYMVYRGALYEAEKVSLSHKNDGGVWIIRDSGRVYYPKKRGVGRCSWRRLSLPFRCPKCERRLAASEVYFVLWSYDGPLCETRCKSCADRAIMGVPISENPTTCHVKES
jgi:hypothetical protein